MAGKAARSDRIAADGAASDSRSAVEQFRRVLSLVGVPDPRGRGVPGDAWRRRGKGPVAAAALTLVSPTITGHGDRDGERRAGRRALRSVPFSVRLLGPTGDVR